VRGEEARHNARLDLVAALRKALLVWWGSGAQLWVHRGSADRMPTKPILPPPPLSVSVSFVQILKAFTPAVTLAVGVAAGVERLTATVVLALLLIGSGTG